jgi:hypothetical protein
MYDYKFIKVDLKTTLRGTKPKEDYHGIVDQQAADGWRLVQIFAPPISGYGSAPYFELIFEKQKQSADYSTSTGASTRFGFGER